MPEKDVPTPRAPLPRPSGPVPVARSAPSSGNAETTRFSSGAYALRLGTGREARRAALAAARVTSEVAAHVTLALFRIGPYLIAIEAARVIEIRAGAVYDGLESPRRPVARADLYELLEVSGGSSCQTVVARADNALGRGDGPRVAFAVDDCDRLVTAPLEALAPLPPVAREQIAIDFLVGVVRLPAANRAADLTGPRVPALAPLGRGPRPTEAAPAGAPERTAFLLDPARLARAAARDRGGRGERG